MTIQQPASRKPNGTSTSIQRHFAAAQARDAKLPVSSTVVTVLLTSTSRSFLPEILPSLDKGDHHSYDYDYYHSISITRRTHELALTLTNKANTSRVESPPQLKSDIEISTIHTITATLAQNRCHRPSRISVTLSSSHTSAHTTLPTAHTPQPQPPALLLHLLNLRVYSALKPRPRPRCSLAVLPHASPPPSASFNSHPPLVHQVHGAGSPADAETINSNSNGDSSSKRVAYSVRWTTN